MLTGGIYQARGAQDRSSVCNERDLPGKGPRIAPPCATRGSYLARGQDGASVVFRWVREKPCKQLKATYANVKK